MVKQSNKLLLLAFKPGDLVHANAWNHTLDTDTIFELIENDKGGLCTCDGPDGYFVLAWAPKRDNKGWIVWHSPALEIPSERFDWKRHQHGRCWFAGSECFQRELQSLKFASTSGNIEWHAGAKRSIQKLLKEKFRYTLQLSCYKFLCYKIFDNKWTRDWKWYFYLSDEIREPWLFE